MDWLIYLFFAVVCSPKQVSLDKMTDLPKAKFGLDVSNLDGKSMIVKGKDYPFQIIYAADWQFHGDSYFLTIVSNKQWEMKHGEALYNNENNKIPLPKKTYTKHEFNFTPKEKGTYDLSFSFDFSRAGQDTLYSQSSIQFEVIKDFLRFEQSTSLSDVVGIMEDKGDLFYMFPVSDFEDNDRIQVVMETSGDAVDLTTPVFYSTNDIRSLDEQAGNVSYVRLVQDIKSTEEDTVSLKKRVVYEIEQFAKDKQDGMTWVMVKMWAKTKHQGPFNLSWTLSTPKNEESYKDSVEVIGDELIVSQQGLESKTIDVYALDTMNLKAYTFNKSAQDMYYVGYYVRKDFNKNAEDFSMFLLNDQGKKIKEYAENERIPVFRYFQYVLDEANAEAIVGRTKGDRILLNSRSKLGYMVKTNKPVTLDFVIEDKLGNKMMQVSDITVTSSNSSIEDLAIDTSLWLSERLGSTIAKTDLRNPNRHKSQNSYMFSINSQNPHNLYDIKVKFLESGGNRSNFEFRDIRSQNVIGDTYVWRNHSVKDTIGFYIELKDSKMTGYYAVGTYNVQIEVVRLSDNTSVVFEKSIHIKDDRLAVRIKKSDKTTLMDRITLVEMENNTFYAMHYYNNYLRAFSQADSFRLDLPNKNQLLFYAKQAGKFIEPQKYHAVADFVNLNVDLTEKEFGTFPIDIVANLKGNTTVTYTYKGPDKSEKKQSFQAVIKPITAKVSLLASEIVDDHGIKRNKVNIFKSTIASIHAKAEPRLFWSVAEGNRPKNTKLSLNVSPLYVNVVKDLKKPNEFELVDQPVVDYDVYNTEGTFGLAFALVPAMAKGTHSYQSKVGTEYKGKAVVKIENKTYPKANKVLVQKSYQFKVTPFEGFTVKRAGANGHKYSITGGRDAVWIKKPRGSYHRWSRKSNQRKGMFNCVKWDLDYYKDFRIFKGEDNWGNIHGIETRGTYYHKQKRDTCLENEKAFRSWDTPWRPQPY